MYCTYLHGAPISVTQQQPQQQQEEEEEEEEERRERERTRLDSNAIALERCDPRRQRKFPTIDYYVTNSLFLGAADNGHRLKRITPLPAQGR